MDTAKKRAAGLYRYRLGLDHVPRRFPTTRRRFPTQPGAASPQPGGASHSPAPLSRLVGRPGHAATGEKFSQRAATRVSRCAAAPSVYDWQLRVQRTVISLQCGPRCSAECDPTPPGARPPDGYSAEEDRWSGRVSGRVRVRRRGHTGPRAPRGRSLVVLRPRRGALHPYSTRRCAVDSSLRNHNKPPAPQSTRTRGQRPRPGGFVPSFIVVLPSRRVTAHADRKI